MLQECDFVARCPAKGSRAHGVDDRQVHVGRDKPRGLSKSHEMLRAAVCDERESFAFEPGPVVGFAVQDEVDGVLGMFVYEPAAKVFGAVVCLVNPVHENPSPARGCRPGGG
ncbi:hypothetical protein DSECCO2_569740 [anaerobic digester metagenome]